MNQVRNEVQRTGVMKVSWLSRAVCGEVVWRKLVKRIMGSNVRGILMGGFCASGVTLESYQIWGGRRHKLDI